MNVLAHGVREQPTDDNTPSQEILTLMENLYELHECRAGTTMNV